ncbi:hypothetical protein BCR33DRAFT_713741 [Rhizoclosmatium globosum]|uniref:Uncharacterized protein n=1 Tax=Rhizoclosmatium globosum TaxID=329046 RepID=A0A1Y2CR36_9FUNG|nr:hypothetical protein BCR33DRAFT_713741 [Rhizoclosmatium globosum]|eukprot:ORY49406.1 hypothetical protein BCR33DRAFT_713741 [Rhizoclosmatium globosum]
MEAMVGEIERRVGGGAGLVNTGGLELAMNVASIGSNVEEAKKEPWAFMGLLGLEVAGGIRWKGRNEEGWRLFWIRNGMPK